VIGIRVAVFMSVRFGDKVNAYETLPFLEERIGLGLFVWDLESDDIQWSDGMFALFGMKPGIKPSAALFLSMTHPDDRISSGWLRHEAKEGRLLDRDFRIVLRDGRVRHLAQRARLVGEGIASKKVWGIRIDVTPLHEERSRAEAQQRRFRALVQALAGMVWLARLDGASVEAFSLSPSEDPAGTNDNWFDGVYPDDQAKVLTAWKDAARQHTPFAINHRFRHADNTIRWHQSRAAPQLDDHGELIAWIGVSLDIHDLIAGQSDRISITGAQIRGARGILNWSVRDLALAAGISVAVLRRLEGFDGPAKGNPAAAKAIRDALEAGGIEFVATTLNKPGVRPR
jgi:PAS domain-containing protein